MELDWVAKLASQTLVAGGSNPNLQDRCLSSFSAMQVRITRPVDEMFLRLI